MLLARRRERLEALAAEIDGDCEVCDVGDRDAVERAATAVLDRHPAIRLLVNNAGIPGRSGFAAADPERVEAVTRVNYLGGVWCLRAFLPGLERARPSHVVNVVSVAGTVAVPGAGPYSAAKHAQLAFSRASSGELRRRGIHVLTVNPGFVETEGFPQRNVLRSRLLRRLVIDPEDVAEHVVQSLERGRTETFVPAVYRVAAVAQTVAPSLLVRVLARAGYGADRP